MLFDLKIMIGLDVIVIINLYEELYPRRNCSPTLSDCVLLLLVAPAKNSAHRLTIACLCIVPCPN